jgi:hypothetical protein
MWSSLQSGCAHFMGVNMSPEMYKLAQQLLSENNLADPWDF